MDHNHQRDGEIDASAADGWREQCIRVRRMEKDASVARDGNRDAAVAGGWREGCRCSRRRDREMQQ